MNTSVLTVRRFRRGQRVCSVGGLGTIKNYKLESGSWTYLVEMELGPLPEMGRIGSETRIWLFEADLDCADTWSDNLAIA
ncbi:MAG: hypothetical protein N4J56_002084 [Chroococcidiopsis sp. SAG 2025]|uniref:hypothetical protein n=1 Tax=Chroococcidiopsis sp. SAG 2025 TaxID=171389 RepID=UPI00293733CB|nr:hypothetical protein [Chroococcidiopsis sp. SAG 2025]MDV2992430.1 hypothetical protein [Chroococcidiopsis sp. SAG 2025]